MSNFGFPLVAQYNISHPTGRDPHFSREAIQSGSQNDALHDDFM
jgi:hypothetical protein